MDLRGKFACISGNVLWVNGEQRMAAMAGPTEWA